MSSPKFERVKELHPGLAVLLDRLLEYIRTQTANEQEYILPKLAAAALKVNEGEAFILLDLLAREGALRRVYNVYCRKNNALLTTVSYLEALDEVSSCDFCNKDHDSQELKVEVAFSVADLDLKGVAA